VIHRLCVVSLAVALCVAPSVLAQDDGHKLVYAPEIGRTITYEVESAGEVDLLSMLIAFDASAAFQVTPTERGEDGVTKETVKYSDLSAELMGTAYQSQYEGLERVLSREATGLMRPESEALPAPDLMSADWLVVLAQLPFLLQFSEESVKPGDEWTIEKRPIISPFKSLSAAEGSDGALDSTFVSQTNSLQEITEWEGRPAAVVKSALTVTFEEQEVSLDLVVDGDFTADMLATVALDTGEILEVKADLGADMIVGMSGAPVEVKVADVEATCRQVKGE